MYELVDQEHKLAKPKEYEAFLLFSPQTHCHTRADPVHF